jgi:hypothetical protein
LVVLLTQALIRPFVGVAAPTAPDMLNRSAPAMRTIAGLRKRPTDFGLDDIDALSCMDPSQNNRDDEEVLCEASWVARCVAATGQTG